MYIGDGGERQRENKKGRERERERGGSLGSSYRSGPPCPGQL